MKELSPVIRIDETKCINCYACISACPVKLCADCSGKTIVINDNMCIGCGHCIDICSHAARHPIDDSVKFLDALKQREKIVAIVAPAVAAVFPGKYLNLNGYLKSLGVEALFDVSFGAELTVVSYLRYIKEKNPRMVIAQPCPAIVNYIQIYQPDLIPYLAPAHSPMLHTIQMIKEFYPQYKNYKIAVISPCIAKKREFEETQLGDYNVTMVALKHLLEAKNINLSSYPSVEYTGAPAERAVLFSAPGGLLDTAERFMPGIRRDTRKIEGVHGIYPYLKSISKNLDNKDIDLPLLVDCLNCEYGCNSGTGTGNYKKALDEVEGPVRKRSKELEKKLNPKQIEGIYKKYNKSLEKFWKTGLYNRSYLNLSENNQIKKPTEAQLNEAFLLLKKEKPSDVYNCTACGYNSCKLMATAIFNKLNKPDHCAHYVRLLLEEERKTIMYINQQFKAHISKAMGIIERINELVAKLNLSINQQSDSVNSSSVITETMVNSLKNTSDLSRKERESVMNLIDNAAKGQGAMKETVLAVQDISTSVEGIASAIKIISTIAANTNLLAMNAAIEAAHAGDAGRGFAVVADEIRRLSESTRENSRNIAQTLSNIINGINTTSKRTGDTNELINEMSGDINSFGSTMAQFIDTLTRLSADSSEITSSLNELKDNSSLVKNDYGEVLSLTDKLRYEINFLAAMSTDIVRAIEENDSEIIKRLVNMEKQQQDLHGLLTQEEN